VTIRSPHRYFQAPGGQGLRYGIDEDLSFYRGAGTGPSVGNVKKRRFKKF